MRVAIKKNQLFISRQNTISVEILDDTNRLQTNHATYRGNSRKRQTSRQ